MRRESFLILLGVLVLVAPFVGLPFSWLAWILPILGVLIIIAAISFRPNRAPREATPPAQQIS